MVFKKRMLSRSGLSLKPRRYFLRDLLIVVGVVLVWRSIWYLADRFLFPENQFASEVVGLVLGLFLLYLPDRDLSRLTGETSHHVYHHSVEEDIEV